MQTTDRVSTGEFCEILHINYILFHLKNLQIPCIFIMTISFYATIDTIHYTVMKFNEF